MFSFKYAPPTRGRRILLILLLCLIFLLTVTGLVWAISGSQIDDFQDGTVQGWSAGIFHPSPPVNIANGGPEGVGDRYLQVISTGGFGSGSAPVTFNSSQWTGDYGAAGVTQIQADMANFGMNPLSMRVAIQGGATRYSSNSAVNLPADGQWHRVSFNLTSSDLTVISGTAPLATVLMNVSMVRFISRASSPGWTGDRVATTLGIDNITAGPADYGNLGPTYGDAWHTLSAAQMGSGVDPDIGPGGDVNDGVTRQFGELWQPGNSVQITITVPGASGYLAAWLDWNADNNFAVSEQVIGTPISAANSSFNLTVPISYTTGTTINTRFRLYDNPPVSPSPTGPGLGGEVEDYTWSFSPTTIKLERLTTRNLSGAQVPYLPLLLIAGVLISTAIVYQARGKPE